MLASASKSVAKLPVGRPTSYRPELGARIADETAKGFSLEAAAAECGIGPRKAVRPLVASGVRDGSDW